MSAFVDPADPQEVELVLAPAVALLGPARLLDALSEVLPVSAGRRGGLFRAAEPYRMAVGDRVLAVDEHQRASLQHVVGGIVLATDTVRAADLAGVLASLVSRAVAEQGNGDEVAVALTSLRDAVDAAG